MRDFEKISFDQFKKDVIEDINLYNEYKLPFRDSDATAGYDIFLLEDLELKPRETKKVPTGIKSFFSKDEVLLLVVRSSMGFKYNLRLCNQVGVIDSDYYNNPDNEGHIWIKIQNEGETKLKFNKGEALVQGMFFKYLSTASDNQNDIKRGSDY